MTGAGLLLAAVLFDGGVTTWKLQRPEPADDPALAWAAEEFVSTVKAVSGAEIPVVATAGASDDVVRLVVVPDRSDDDNLRYRLKDAHTLEFAGNSPRAVQYAVFSFLKRELGVRWLWYEDDGTFCPPRKRYDIPDGLDYRYTPPIRYRGWHIGGDGWRDHVKFRRWMAHHGMNIHRHGAANEDRNIRPFGCWNMWAAHNAQIADKKTFEAHPDWGAEYNGIRKIDNICFSSPGCARHIADRMEEYLARYPQTEILEIFPNDNQDYCQCAKCRAAGVSTGWFSFLNLVTDEIRRRHPKLKLGTLAYQGYRDVPACALRNLDFVEYTTHDRCNFHPLSDPTCKQNDYDRQHFDAWEKTGVPVGHYTYEYDMFSRNSQFTPFFSLVDDLGNQALKRHHVLVIPEISLWPATGPIEDVEAVKNRLPASFFQSKMWDPTLTFDAWLADTCRYAYGAGAKEMERYFRGLDAAWRGCGRHHGILGNAMNVVEDFATDRTLADGASALDAVERAIVACAHPWKVRWAANVRRERHHLDEWRRLRGLRRGEPEAVSTLKGVPPVRKNLMWFTGSYKRGEVRAFPQGRIDCAYAGFDVTYCTNAVEAAAAVEKADAFWVRNPGDDRNAVVDAPTLKRIAAAVRDGKVLCCTGWGFPDLAAAFEDPSFAVHTASGANIPLALAKPIHVAEGSWLHAPNEIERRVRNCIQPYYVCVPSDPSSWTELYRCNTADGKGQPGVLVRRVGKGLVCVIGAEFKIDPAQLTANLLHSLTAKPFLTAAGERRDTADTMLIARELTNTKEVRSAVWTTTALGVYRAYVNGKAREDAILKPGFTHPIKCRHLQTWDVTALLSRAAGARNVFAAEVTGGWYRDGAAGYRGQPRGKDAGFWGELKVVYADGSVQTLTTDGSWRATYGGPLRKADIFYGESFDARQSRDYLTNATVFASWKPAVTNWEFAGELRPEKGSPVVYREDLAMKPQGVRKVKGRGEGEEWMKFPLLLKKGEKLILDFGQNHAGVPEFTAVADCHTQLTLRFAEMLNDADAPARACDGPKGSLYFRNYRHCRTQFDYWFKGGETTYRPAFSYWGYRYMSVEAGGTVTIKSIKSVPISSVAPTMECGTLETGDKTLNRFIENVRWGLRSNFVSVPTDCPQRDERQGWAGDIQVFTPAALYQARVAPILDKWMDDFVDSVLPCGEFFYVAPSGGVDLHDKARFGFADAGIIVPWTLWKMTGDVAAARRCWPAMTRHFASVFARRYETPANGAQFGDWLSQEKWETNRDDLWQTSDPNVRRWWRYLGLCYLLNDARMLSDLSRMGGSRSRATASAQYAAHAATLLAELRRDFFDGDDLIAPFRDQQGAAAFALDLGLPPTKAAEERIFARLAAAIRADGNRFKTGFFATLPLMKVLGKRDPALAYAVLLQHGCPGWLYAVGQGATTVWERWDSWTKERGFPTGEISSYNHFAYGAVVAWLYDYAAGIRPDPEKGGFRHFVLEPHPDRRLGFCHATFDGGHGRIVSDWRYEGGKVKYRFEIPEGCAATLCLPGEKPREVTGTVCFWESQARRESKSDK